MPFVKHHTCLPKQKFLLKNHQHNRRLKGCTIHMQCLGGIHSKYGYGQICPNLHRQCLQHVKYIKHLEGSLPNHIFSHIVFTSFWTIRGRNHGWNVLWAMQKQLFHSFGHITCFLPFIVSMNQPLVCHTL